MDPDWDGAGLLGPWVEMHLPLNADQVLLVPSVLWHLICLRLLNIFLLCVHMLSFFFFLTVIAASVQILQFYSIS